MTPGPTNVRTRVNEYGGGEYGVRDGVVVCSDLGDGRLRRIDPDGIVTVLTAEGPVWYGDPEVQAGRGIVVAVREDHREAALAGHGEAVTTLVSIPLRRVRRARPGRGHGPRRRGGLLLHAAAVTTTTASPGPSGTTRTCRGTPPRCTSPR